MINTLTHTQANTEQQAASYARSACDSAFVHAIRHKNGDSDTQKLESGEEPDV